MDFLPSLGLLMEVLGTKSLPGSLDLISSLLDTLNHTVQYALSTQADLSFVQQLTMSAIENTAEKITVGFFVRFLAAYQSIQFVITGGAQFDA